MMELSRLGHHTILDMYDCDSEILDNPKALKTIMLEGARMANATIITSHFHQFTPQGVSGCVIIAESHFNIHTWPEHRYAAIDLFTCGVSLDSTVAIEHLIEQLSCRRHTLTQMDRGQDYIKPK